MSNPRSNRATAIWVFALFWMFFLAEIGNIDYDSLEPTLFEWLLLFWPFFWALYTILRPDEQNPLRGRLILFSTGVMGALLVIFSIGLGQHFGFWYEFVEVFATLAFMVSYKVGSFWYERKQPG